MTSDKTTFGLGLTAGIWGSMIGLLSAGFGIALAVTGWRWLGIGSAYFAFGGLAIGLTFLVVAWLARAAPPTRGSVLRPRAD